MGLWNWLFGKKKTETNTVEDPHPIKPAESSLTITFTASCECRPMTSAQVAEAHAWYTKAFDWVLQTETLEISDEDRKKLFDFLLAKWNSSRIGKAELEALHIHFSWPRGEAHIAQKKHAAMLDACESIDGLRIGEALGTLKAAELKQLMADYKLSVQGRATKAVMTEALLGLDNIAHEDIRRFIVSRLKQQEARRALVTQHEVVEMLHFRIMRASGRMRRAVQIMDRLTSPGVLNYTHIKVFVCGSDSVADCGLKEGDIYPADELLKRATTPSCESLDCRCSFSPYPLDFYTRQ